MRGTTLFATITLALCLSRQSLAATVEVAITGTDGRPAVQAVAELFPETQIAGPASKLPSEALVDQRDETFIPLVTIIRRGGHVSFRNSDHTMHQVYSFSDIKQFAFEVDRGQTSKPVIFETPGVAAIGCNIHDEMVTFVYVAETPWAGGANTNGLAEIRDVPPGRYRVSVWDPQLMPGFHPEAATITVTDNGAKLDISVPLQNAGVPAKKHSHAKSY